MQASGWSACHAVISGSGEVFTPKIIDTVGCKAAHATALIDCYDCNKDAKKGQTAFYVYDRGDGEFDYDCNNLEEPPAVDTGDDHGNTVPAPIATAVLEHVVRSIVDDPEAALALVRGAAIEGDAELKSAAARLLQYLAVDARDALADRRQATSPLSAW